MYVAEPNKCKLIKNLTKFLKEGGTEFSIKQNAGSCDVNMHSTMVGDAETLLKEVKNVCKLSDSSLIFRSGRSELNSLGVRRVSGMNDYWFIAYAPKVNGRDGIHPGQVILIILSNGILDEKRYDIPAQHDGTCNVLVSYSVIANSYARSATADQPDLVYY